MVNEGLKLRITANEYKISTVRGASRENSVLGAVGGSGRALGSWRGAMPVDGFQGE